jgi:nitroreductase
MIQEIRDRRSIRKYTNQAVDDQMIMQVLESGRLAPSGSNTQPWQFIVVQSDEMRQQLSDVSHNQQWMMTAPVHIVCIGDMRSRTAEDVEVAVDEKSSSPELKQIIRDTAIAIEHIVLEAESLGLSTCWIAWFVQEEIRPVLNVPEDKYIVGVLTLGYADETPKARPRKTLEDMVRYEIW